MAAEKRKQKRTSHDEHEERIALVRRLLGLRLRKGEIKKRMRKKYGNVAAATIEKYLTRARDDLVLEVQRGKLEQRAVGLECFETVIRDPKTPAKDRVAAQRAINEMLGLNVKVPADPRAILELLGIRPDDLDRLRRLAESQLRSGATDTPDPGAQTLP